MKGRKAIAKLTKSENIAVVVVCNISEQIMKMFSDEYILTTENHIRLNAPY